MAVIEFVDETEAATAAHAEIYDEWVVATIKGENGNVNRHCIPRERIEQIVGHKSGDDVSIKS